MIQRDDAVSRYFMTGVGSFVGNGENTSFWRDVWIGDSSLREAFPRLFSISMQHNDSVGDMGAWENHSWTWKFQWRRRLFTWEETMLTNLKQKLATCVLHPNGKDKIIWRHLNSGVFTVKSVASYLESLHFPGDNPLTAAPLYNQIWQGLAPPKVEVFTWVLLNKKLPTRSVLMRRGIIPIAENICPLCGEVEESVDHLFCHCSGPSFIWYSLARWWGIAWCSARDICSLFEQWVFMEMSGSLQRKAWRLIFYVVVWSIWKARNDLIFRNKQVSWPVVHSLIYHRLLEWGQAFMPSLLHKHVMLESSAAPILSLSNTPVSRQVITQIWSPPQEGYLKWNVDGSSMGKPGLAGMGGVLRNEEGQVLCSFCCHAGICDSNQAEYMAIQKALQLSANSPVIRQARLILESDSSNACGWVATEGNVPWKLQFIHNDVSNSKLSIRSLDIVHIPREINGMADALAREGVYLLEDKINWL